MESQRVEIILSPEGAKAWKRDKLILSPYGAMLWKLALKNEARALELRESRKKYAKKYYKKYYKKNRKKLLERARNYYKEKGWIYHKEYYRTHREEIIKKKLKDTQE